MDKAVEDKAKFALHLGVDAVRVMLAENEEEQEEEEFGQA